MTAAHRRERRLWLALCLALAAALSGSPSRSAVSAPIEPLPSSVFVPYYLPTVQTWPHVAYNGPRRLYAVETELPATPRPSVRPGASLAGDLTYYCNWTHLDALWSRCTHGYPDGPGQDFYGAAGPELRRLLGDWRGRTVTVTGADGQHARLTLVDFCACGGSHVLDAYRDFWAYMEQRGTVNPVRISW